MELLTENKILSEKLLILKGIAIKENSAFVYDKDFGYKVCNNLIRMGSNLQMHEKTEINNWFLDSFKVYKLGTIRALLNNLHFLYLTKEIKLQFDSLFEKVVEVTKSSESDINLLLHELDLFSNTEQEVTKAFIAFLIEKLALNENQLRKLLHSDSKYNQRFKFIVFKVNTTHKNNLEILFDFYLEFCASQAYKPFLTNQLMTEFSKTGKEGFKLALEMFKRRRDAASNAKNIRFTSLLLTSFKNELSEMIISWNDTYAPIKKLIEPGFLSIFLISERSKRDDLMRKLIKWNDSDSNAAEILKTLINTELIINPDFLDLFNPSTKKLIPIKFGHGGMERSLANQITTLQRIMREKEDDIDSIVSIFYKEGHELIHYSLQVRDPKFTIAIYKAVKKWARNVYNNRSKPSMIKQVRKLNNFTHEVFIIYNFNRLEQRIKHALISEPPFRDIYLNGILKRPDAEQNLKNNKLLNECSPHIKRILETELDKQLRLKF